MATNDGGKAPRAVIHKRILDSAETEPDASLEALAAAVPGASPDLVERVLEEYGDPGSGPGETPVDPTTMSEPATPVREEELTEHQRETLEAIAERPEATQSELAEALGVSRAAVNKRLAGIEGFDWADRHAFVGTVLDGEGVTRSPDDGPQTGAAVDGGQLLDADDAAAVEQLQERVARLEAQLEAAGGEPAIADAELLAKVLRAVMADDDIAEDEEVRVLEALR